MDGTFQRVKEGVIISQDGQKLWKDPISAQERIHHELLFYSQGPVDGYMSGNRARDLFLHSRLPLTVLSQIWNLADVSNDNVLSVEEFVVAMHLILKVKEGLPIPRSLPKHLVPKLIPSPEITDISQKERDAYQNVFNKISQENIDAIQGRLLMMESELSVEELSHIWDLSDINRDGQLDQNEWSLTCHLIRHRKQGGNLSGPVNVFELVPQCYSSVTYQARKHRVEEYNKKKHQLMTAKEKRKAQIDVEKRRLELLKKRFALHKELYECSRSSCDVTVPEEEYNLYKEKEESNIDKVEAVIYRLKKEHEQIRQHTVKAILGEQGSLQEDGRLVKLEQEDVRHKLSTYHTKATKDADPFHQLYELRRDLRKRSTLSEGEEPEVHFPFNTNPFDKESLQPNFSGQSIFVSPDPRVFNNNNSHKGTPTLKELCGFGDGFIERWSGLQSDTSDTDYDPVFMSLNVPMDPRSWSGVGWSEKGGGNIDTLHQKLVDLKGEIQKLNDDNGGQLLFRNPEEYLARQKAKEEEEKLEKNRYQRRYGSDKRSDKDVSKRRSFIPSHDEETQRAAREYRQKRRSVNLDKKSDNSDKSNTERINTSGGEKQVSSEKKSQLKISTDTTDAFAPESASSPRSSKTGATSPRSTTSPRPSTKRKAAPPPPVSTSVSSTTSSVTPVSPPNTVTESAVSPTVKQAAAESSSTKPTPQPRSPNSKIPKPVTNQESQNSKPTTPQKNSEQLPSEQSENKSGTPHEIIHPSRPPRRKRLSEENRSFLHESFEKEQNRKSKEIAVNVDIKDCPVTLAKETTVTESKTDEVFPEPDSYNGKEDSLLDTIIKELPILKTDNQVAESEIKPVINITEQTIPVDKNVDDVIQPDFDSGVESEIKPVKVDKPQGRLIESNIVSKINFTENKNESEKVNHIDSDDEKELIITSENKTYSDRNNSVDSDEPDGYLDHIKPVTYNKRNEEVLQAFERIVAFPEKDRLKDTKDTISIASDISVSSAGSEAPPLPDSAPPPLQLLHATPSLSEVNEVTEPEESKTVTLNTDIESGKPEISEVIEPESTQRVETAPDMSEVIPEITEKASPREVVSPINELKASMFSMRVTSPTRDMTVEIKTNGELTVDTNMDRHEGSSDSDISDNEGVSNVRGTFTPGEQVMTKVPMATYEDDGGIQLISYNAKLNSPSSDQSGPDSAFEDMQSSMTSNDPLSNTIDEFSPEEFVAPERVEKVESVQKQVGRSFILEFDTDGPKGGTVLSPTSNKDFMMRAQQFADSVQRPPKMTVKLKREIQTPQDLTDEKYLQLEAERRAVINSSTVKKRDTVVVPAYDEDAQADRPPSPDPDDSIQEWRSEVNKRSNIPWEEKPEKVNLYSENIIQETENTDTVDRESIANLSRARQQWETKAQELEDKSPRKQKQPQQVRHWEVKLPTQLKKVPADAIRTTKQDSDSESENMADTEFANESAIEREIRLAMEREELLKKEQEERTSLQERQMASVKKETFEKIEQNNNKPTYHEMTEADRGSELQQREELIQLELFEQEEREAAMRSDTQTYEDSSHSSGDEDENPNESIIEREIRLQQERERELNERRQQVNVQDKEPVTEEVDEEETITIEYTEAVRASPTPASTLTETPISTPDDLSEAEDQTEKKTEMRTRISYEEAISSASHDGESLIARELREAREREEELQKQRKMVAGGNTSKPATPKQTVTPSANQTVSNTPVSNQKPTYQKDVSPFKQERKQSTDSLSSGHSSEKPQNVTPKNVRIGAFGSGGKMTGLDYKTPDKPIETKRQETPIEREIRLARERENEYRVSKGLPPLKDEKPVDYDIEPGKEEVSITKTSFFSPAPQNKGHIQKMASSRLQKEINKQNALEKKYREEGKILSTSEDHVGLLKYTDIATQEGTTPGKRNFSITRKSTKKEPIVDQKQNGTTEPKSATLEKPPPKFNRSVSGGSVTFSYKESRHKAESKIEQELREMREREEELRNQRTESGVVSPRSPRSTDTTSVLNKRSQFEQTS